MRELFEHASFSANNEKLLERTEDSPGTRGLILTS